jgi:hypothetical protein
VPATMSEQSSGRDSERRVGMRIRRRCFVNSRRRRVLGKDDRFLIRRQEG